MSLWVALWHDIKIIAAVAMQAFSLYTCVLLFSALQVCVGQPSYAVKILYRSRGSPLQGASRIWAHIGHSGWRDTLDVALSSGGPEGDPEVGQGFRAVVLGPFHAR